MQIKRILFISLLLLPLAEANSQRYGTGLIFDDYKVDHARSRACYNEIETEQLPVAYSLKAYSPGPGNQLQLNTSPAWATSWSSMSILENIYNSEKNPGESNNYSPAYLYQNTRTATDFDCSAGIGLVDALEFLTQYDLPLFDDFQEFCPRNLPEAITPAPPGKTLDYRKIFHCDQSPEAKINAVKKSLSENLPVVTGMYCPPSFFTTSSYWQPKELMSFDYPGQALCVVGYDDDQYGGAFEVLNSWGSEWGNDGYTWINYEDFLTFTRYAFELFYIANQEEINHFAGSIELRLNTNKAMTLDPLRSNQFRCQVPLVTGTHFRISLKNDQPTYVYVFGVDELNEYFRIFPHRNDISPAVVYTSGKVAIPGEDNYIEITGAPGKETLCILYTKVPIDLEDLLKKLEKYPGEIDFNLAVLLNAQIMDERDVIWSEDRRTFSASSSERSALFIRIEIDHI
jgi:hypothetical protein